MRHPVTMASRSIRKREDPNNCVGAEVIHAPEGEEDKDIVLISMSITLARNVHGVLGNHNSNDPGSPWTLPVYHALDYALSGESYCGDPQCTIHHRHHKEEVR
jgi:hypothetical protein